MTRDPLERYLRNVATGLPETQCEDIVRELREDIQSEMEDKERKLGRALSDAEQMTVLKARGNPFVLAAHYRQDDRSVAFGRRLIGPVLFLSGQKLSVCSIFSTCLLQLLIQF